jgi:hypothetical protein
MNELFAKLDSLFGWDGYEVLFLPSDGACHASIEVYKIEDENFSGSGCNRTAALGAAIKDYDNRYGQTAASIAIVSEIKSAATEISENLRRLAAVGISSEFYLQDDNVYGGMVIKLHINPVTEEHIPISIGRQGNLRVEIE